MSVTLCSLYYNDKNKTIYEHIQQKHITNQQATTEHVQQPSSAERHSFIVNTGSKSIQLVLCAEKGPFLWFYFRHASLMYRHESNVFVLLFIFYVLIFFFFFTDFHPNAMTASLVSSHSLLQSSLKHDCETARGFSFLFFFFTKESHIQDMTWKWTIRLKDWVAVQRSRT